jgi:hypothetical protein
LWKKIFTTIHVEKLSIRARGSLQHQGQNHPLRARFIYIYLHKFHKGSSWQVGGKRGRDESAPGDFLYERAMNVDGIEAARQVQEHVGPQKHGHPQYFGHLCVWTCHEYVRISA